MYVRTVCCHVDAATALHSLDRGMLDDVTCHIGLILGKDPPFVHSPSWVPTVVADTSTRSVSRVSPCEMR